MIEILGYLFPFALAFLGRLGIAAGLCMIYMRIIIGNNFPKPVMWVISLATALGVLLYYHRNELFSKKSTGTSSGIGLFSIFTETSGLDALSSYLHVMSMLLYKIVFSTIFFSLRKNKKIFVKAISIHITISTLILQNIKRGIDLNIWASVAFQIVQIANVIVTATIIFFIFKKFSRSKIVGARKYSDYIRFYMLTDMVHVLLALYAAAADRALGHGSSILIMLIMFVIQLLCNKRYWKIGYLRTLIILSIGGLISTPINFGALKILKTIAFNG